MLFCLCLLSNTYCETVRILGNSQILCGLGLCMYCTQRTLCSFCDAKHLTQVGQSVLVSICHANKYNLLVCFSFIYSTTFSDVLISASYKILFAELDYTSGSFSPKCQAALSNSMVLLFQSFEPTIKSSFSPPWLSFVFADKVTKIFYHSTLLKAEPRQTACRFWPG